MLFIIVLLASLAFGSALWTVVQLLKPEWFFIAEDEANMKRVRPTWYLFGGIVGILCILVLWYQAILLKLTSVWILTAIMTLGSIKPLGMVFFYDKFSGEMTALVQKMQSSKATYWSIVAARGVLSIVLVMATLYFVGRFGPIN